MQNYLVSIIFERLLSRELLFVSGVSEVLGVSEVSGVSGVSGISAVSEV